MAITRPTGEQLRFRSQYTGDHVLDTYLEAAEKGGRSVPDLLDDLFDSSGVFRDANFEFRFNPTDDKLQFRVGNFASATTGWSDLTTFFNITGTFNAATTYNNFDVVTLTDKDVYIIHGLSSGTTFANEAALEASAYATKLVDVSEAREWASKTDGQVRSTDYSAKAWAVGGTGVTNTANRGSAKDWAIKTSGTVDGTNYSAKYWATHTDVVTVSTNIANVNTTATNITNVNTVATSIANVNTTATNIASVNTVAAEIGTGQDVTVTAANITSVNTVAGSISNVNTTATNIANVNTVAAEINNNNLQTVAAQIAAVITTANDLNEAVSEIDTVANSIANVNIVGTGIANVNTVAGSIANVNTVAGISANVTTVAGISTNVTTVATNNANVTTVAGINTDVTTVAGISGNVTTVANNDEDVTTVATNISDVNTVATNIGTISAKVSKSGDTMTGNLTFGDNKYAYFGSGGATDMKIWYNGTNGSIEVVNGALTLEGGGSTLITNSSNNIISTQGDSAYLHYAGSTKLNTTSTGIDVTGVLKTTGDISLNTTDGKVYLSNAGVGNSGIYVRGINASNTLRSHSTGDHRWEISGSNRMTLNTSGLSVTGNITLDGTVDGRDVASDGSKLDGIESGATADQSASEILTAIKTVDGSGSGLDADTLDGNHASAFVATSGATMTGNLSFGDNDEARFGAGNDLKIYHGGSDSYVDDTGTGSLLLRGSNSVQLRKVGTDEVMLKAIVDGAVTLYYDNSQKLATTSTGVSVTGTVAATSYTGDGSALTGIDALPSQSGQSGNYLTTDGSTASWAALDTDANSTTKGLYEHANTISSNYSITSGNNAMSAGAITINSGVSVTVPSGSTWTIV